MQPVRPALESAKLPGIHGLRGAAALSVVFFHLLVIPRLVVLPDLVHDIVLHFHLSVLLFFALSAFTLAHSARVVPSSYAAYLARRFFRIAPLFYAAMAAMIYWGGIRDFRLILTNATFAFNLVPGYEDSLVWSGWSVGVEMLFYLILPAILLACRGPRSAGVGFVLATLLSVATWRAFDATTLFPKGYAYYFIGANLGVFLAGVLAYRVFTAREALPPGTVRALPAATLAVVVIAYLDPMALHNAWTGLYYGVWSIACGLLCLWQALEPSRILTTRAAQWLGERSYGIYLVHPIVVLLGRRIYVPLRDATGLEGGALYLACAAITLPVVFALAEAGYRLVERPGMRLGSRLSRAIDGDRSGVGHNRPHGSQAPPADRDHAPPVVEPLPDRVR